MATDHDYVVQAKDAFDQTIMGLHNLARWGQRVEIRVVLHAQTVSRLPELAEFIYRNLTFAEHVALMGLEYIGYTPRNMDLLWVDPYDYQDRLAEAVRILRQRSMNVSIYNHQLCVLRPDLWRYAKKSISDWKNIYLDECTDCGVRNECGGFFKWATKVHSRAYTPGGMRDAGEAGNANDPNCAGATQVSSQQLTTIYTDSKSHAGPHECLHDRRSSGDLSVLSVVLFFAIDTPIRNIVRTHWKVLLVLICIAAFWRWPFNDTLFHGLEYEDSYVYTVAARTPAPPKISKQVGSAYLTSTCVVGSIDSCQEFETYSGHYIGWPAIIRIAIDAVRIFS